MDKKYYEAIFKRKSFHLFRNVGDEHISMTEIDEIYDAWKSFEPIYKDIKTDIRIVTSAEVNFKRDAEYCILIYSEDKDNYLLNAGYLGEQLDLFLVSHNIGTLWYGIGRPDIKTYNGMEYVIMIAVHKVNDETLYRKDMYKAKRKELAEIWEGDTLGIAEIARFSPSACNTQPWYVKNEKEVITVYRKLGKRGIMPAKAVKFYNRIDIGIYLLILETCMAKEGIEYIRKIYIDDGEKELTKVASYAIY